MKNNYNVNLFNLKKSACELSQSCLYDKTNPKKTSIEQNISYCKTLIQTIKCLKLGLIFYFCNYIIFLSSNSAIAFTIDTPIIEGALIRGTQNCDEKLYLGQTMLPATPTGRFYFALPQDAVSPLQLKVLTQNTQKEYSFPIEKRQWEEQHINGLPNAKVKINPENQKRIQKENALLRKARTHIIDTFFPICFTRPVKQPYRISGAFGNRRIFNNQVPAGHSGTDYAAPKGTPTYAVADGVIVVTHQDMFLSGKTVLVNHGYGVFSAYSHLSQIDVKIGQTVKQGDIIGKIGATGRATGPHLHFTITWYSTRVDPEQVLTAFACPADNI